MRARDLQTAAPGPARRPTKPTRRRGSTSTCSAKQFEGFAASPSEIKSAVVTLPRRPDDQPRRRRRAERLHRRRGQLRHRRARPTAPTTPRSGPSSVGSPTLDGRLTGSLYFGEPKPGDQYRLFMVFDGFGMHAKLVGSVRPGPADRPGHGRTSKTCPRSRSKTSTSTSSPPTAGLMATPTRCTIYDGQRPLLPLERNAPRLRLGRRTSASDRARTAPAARARSGRSSRASRRAPPTRAPAPSRNFHLKLDRDDGDQFLGDLNFRMPPGFTGDLRGISYCPEAVDPRRGARTSGRAELAAPSCPRLEPDRDDERRRRPRRPPVPRDREDVPGGAVQGRAPEPGGDHAGARRAL